jgi:glutamate dehydrogenase/leucine dehydrogenase
MRLAPDLEGPAREKALEGFGRQLGPIIRAGLYYPGMDINCGPAELRRVYAGAGIVLGHTTDSSFFTAVGVASAIQGCADALGLSRPATLAIEGFGSVGTHLAALLSPEEFRITTISTVAGALSNPNGFAPAELQRTRAKHGDELVHHLAGTTLSMPEVLIAPVDILVPAARTGSITEDVARGLRARAVVPAANAPYRPGSAGTLHERGVLCLPGCLCNAGGVLGSSLVDSGVPRERVEDLFRSRYRPMVRDLVAACLEKRLSPVAVVEAVATREAEGRAARGSAGTLSRSLPRRAFRKLSREAGRRLPRALRRRAMWRRAQRAFDALDADFREVGSP